MRFSAAICVYYKNDAEQLREALNSALVQQTVKPSELVVVYDGPVDDSLKCVIRQVAFGIPTLEVQFAENRGHGAARSAAIEKSTLDWVAIVDSDDISRPIRFERLTAVVRENPTLAVVGGGITEFMDVNGERKIGPDRLFPRDHADVVKFASQRSPVAQPTCMLRRSAVLAVGNYQDWFNNEDYFLWLRLIHAGFHFHNVQESLLLFRTSPDVYARRGGWRYWTSEVRLQLYSFRNGTTKLHMLIAGAAVRFIVQVAMGPASRAWFYRAFLRR